MGKAAAADVARRATLPTDPGTTSAAERNKAGFEVAKRAKEFIKQGKAKDQKSALQLVKSTDPKLWSRYLTGRA